MTRLFRIAPTPSGYLHKGNIFNFLLTAKLAKDNDAKLMLRIDDLDAERVKQEYVDDIFRVLNQLELQWDLGPKTAGDFIRDWSQISRWDLYLGYLNQLKETRQVFACECSRKELPKNGIYPGTCTNKNLSLENKNLAWRVKERAEIIQLEDQKLGTIEMNPGKELGSFIVRRRDGIPSYQLSSLADDVHFGITDIVRGKDLFDSTFMQLQLAEMLDLPAFQSIQFYHHNLITDGKEKLSKSAGLQAEPLEFDAKEIKEEFEAWLK
ncbi:MAG: tRNA glutamyl-Q synthetase [Bacteroidetes bacterium]|nr:tRNA glutamyl-Q synthetase [Bacteroidota bacterium]